MTIKFAVLSLNKKSETNAKEVFNELVENLDAEIIFDNNYEDITNGRLQVYKDKEIDVVTVGVNSITLRFTESFNNAELMSLPELITCLESYIDNLNNYNTISESNNSEDNDETHKTKKSNKKSEDEDNEEMGGCILC